MVLRVEARSIFLQWVNSTRALHDRVHEWWGGFLNLTGEEAYKTLDELSDNSQQWDFSSRRGKGSTTIKKGGLYEVKDNDDIMGQFKDLMRTVEAITLNKLVTAANNYQVDICSLCASPMHFAAAHQRYEVTNPDPMIIIESRTEGIKFERQNE
jgi:hypothetical protein